MLSMISRVPMLALAVLLMSAVFLAAAVPFANGLKTGALHPTSTLTRALAAVGPLFLALGPVLFCRFGSCSSNVPVEAMFSRHTERPFRCPYCGLSQLLSLDRLLEHQASCSSAARK